jgi:hypothetical protein
VAVKSKYARTTPVKPNRAQRVTIVFVLLFLLSAVLSFPDPAASDCVDLERATSYYVQGAHTVIFYEGMRPVALLEVPYCAIRRESTVHLTKNYLCDFDDILIDGDVCSIMTVSSPSARSY